MYNFPDTPITGQQILTTSGVIYRWDGAKWTSIATNILTSGLVVQGPADLKNQTVLQSGANLAINRALGENCILSLTANITVLSIIGWPTAGITGKVRLIVNNTGVFGITWPSGFIWPGGVIPAITSGVGKKDIYLFMTDDNSITIYASVVGQDYH